MKVIIACKLSR